MMRTISGSVSQTQHAISRARRGSARARSARKRALALLDETKLHRAAAPRRIAQRLRSLSPRERLLGFRLARLRHNRPMLEHRLLLQLLDPSAAREKQAHHLRLQ